MERARFNVRLQNLLNIHKRYSYDLPKSQELMLEAKGLKKPSYLDMKMGTNCVLRSITSKSYLGFREYDLATTTIKHGFRVTGFCMHHDN